MYRQLPRLLAACIALSVLGLSTLSFLPGQALAASVTAGSADQLACQLSPAGNPAGYRTWWAATASNGRYAGWLWHDIVPHSGSSACRQDVASTLWLRAVPENWAPVKDIGGWPWPSGGYYAQQLWLHAVPDNWDYVGDIGGWPWPAGGYYAQQLWLHAVPDNWAPVGNVGGWPWPGGGYYTQWLWLHAIPDNWASAVDVGGWPWPAGGYYTQWFWLHAVPDNWAGAGSVGGWPWPAGGYYTQWLWLHAIPDSWAPTAALGLGHLPAPTAISDFVQADQGYYRYWFWEGAVPDAWRPMPDIGGWRAAAGGYYEQWFWLHAAPDEWAPNAAMAIGGAGSRGYYDYTFYHFATVRDFAWRSSLSIDGSAGAGYFDHWYHGSLGQTVPHYQQLLALAGGYLAGATTFRPVGGWLDPNAQAAVVLSFDDGGTDAELCAVTSVLRQHGVTATFYLISSWAQVFGQAALQCLSGMDVQDHTSDHPGGFPLEPQTLMDTYTAAAQQAEVHDAIAQTRSVIPDAAMTSLRTPWCDGNKSVDQSVLQSAAAAGMTSDSSVATVGAYARQAGLVPELGLDRLSLSAFPSPYVAVTGGGQLVELPFAYPSDWTAASIHGLDASGAPPAADAPGYAVTAWEREFDEVYAQHGVMVVLMHPWLQAPNGQAPAGLDALVTYMQSKPNVTFTSMSAADAGYRKASGLR